MPWAVHAWCIPPPTTFPLLTNHGPPVPGLIGWNGRHDIPLYMPFSLYRSGHSMSEPSAVEFQQIMILFSALFFGEGEGEDCNDMSPSHARRVKRSRLFRHATSALPAKHWRRAPFYAFMDAKVSNRQPRHHKPSFTGSVSVLCFSQYAHGHSYSSSIPLTDSGSSISWERTRIWCLQRVTGGESQKTDVSSD